MERQPLDHCWDQPTLAVEVKDYEGASHDWKPLEYGTNTRPQTGLLDRMGLLVVVLVAVTTSPSTPQQGSAHGDLAPNGDLTKLRRKLK